MIGRVYLERGRPVVVLVRWAGHGPRNVAIRREDGTIVVRPFRGLRKPPPEGVQVALWEADISEENVATVKVNPRYL